MADVITNIKGDNIRIVLNNGESFVIDFIEAQALGEKLMDTWKPKARCP